MEVIEKLVFEVNIYKAFSQFFYHFFPYLPFPLHLSLPSQISQPYLPFLRKLMALRNW